MFPKGYKELFFSIPYKSKSVNFDKILLPLSAEAFADKKHHRRLVGVYGAFLLPYCSVLIGACVDKALVQLRKVVKNIAGSDRNAVGRVVRPSDIDPDDGGDQPIQAV